MELTLKATESEIPILGVCLGHQTIAQAFGGDIVRCHEFIHGKMGEIHHDSTGLFEGIPEPFSATRYHSLIVSRENLPGELKKTAWLKDGTIMGLSHKKLPIFGVQFHPESIASEHGHKLVKNFISNTGIKPLIYAASEGPLSTAQAKLEFDILFEGKATPSQVGGFLMAMRARGESVSEYSAAAEAMRSRCIPVDAPSGSIDIVGTGGDGVGTLNISTAAAFAVAGAGVTVAKHGNRNLSSKSGAADALTALGINVMVEADVVEAEIRNAGIGFMMAPMHHPATKHVMPIRQELGCKTIFNILGPLTNPAGVKRQLSGAFAPDLLFPMAETLDTLGCEKAWLVHGSDGTDELTIVGVSTVVELFDGKISSFEVHPEDAGLPTHKLSEILGGSPAENASELKALLEGKKSAYRDAVLLNSSAALLIAGKCDSLKEGVEYAADSIDSGKAKKSLELVKKVSNGELRL